MTKCGICGKVHRTTESAMKAHGYKVVQASSLGGVSSRLPGLKKRYSSMDRKKQSKNSAGHKRHPIKPSHPIKPKGK